MCIPVSMVKRGLIRLGGCFVDPRASVGVHLMTPQVDEGPVLVEEFVDVTGLETVEAVYNRLYP